MASTLNKLKQSFSVSILTNLFTLWFLLFPFDGYFLPASIGFMTLYPYLIITFFLLAYSFLGTPVELPDKKDKWTIAFFAFWLLYALIYSFFVVAKSHAFYEVRSLILMGTTVWLLFRMNYIIGKKALFDRVHHLAIFIFVVLVIIALAEFFTGIHFAGAFTERIYKLPAQMVTYAPVFLYDNPNNFMSYLFGLALIILITDKESTRKPLKFLLLITILFFFSQVADSRFGKIAVFILILVFLYGFFSKLHLSTIKKYTLWVSITAFCLLFCLLTKPLYYGPMWKDSEHYVINSMNPMKIENDKPVFYSIDSLVNQYGEKKIAQIFWTSQAQGHLPSVVIRKNLLLNGFYLFKHSKGLGVGPGQYRYYHENHLVPYNISTVTSPHDGLMEILSQYGLLVFIPYCVLMLMYWSCAASKWRRNTYAFLIISAGFIIYVIISDMPSAFLNLNIGWIVFPLLLLSASHFELRLND